MIVIRLGQLPLSVPNIHCRAARVLFCQVPVQMGFYQPFAHNPRCSDDPWLCSHRRFQPLLTCCRPFLGQ